jgi:hypothetical protein
LRTYAGALAEVVNAISQLDITKAWGDGSTSSSDGQRFSLRRKVLHNSYSHAFNDFALEFLPWNFKILSRTIMRRTSAPLMSVLTATRRLF